MTGNRSIDRIVVGIDGSEQSKLALRWAGTLSTWTGAPILAVTTWHIPASYAWAAGSSYVPPGIDLQADAERMQKELLAEILADQPSLDVQTLVREGSAAQVLLEHCGAASLLVVGSRGHGGFAGLLLGSVSSYCAEHAGCPVLVVHGDRPPVIANRPE